MKAYYYIDSYNREILHIPKIFYAIKPFHGRLNVVLSPDNLLLKEKLFIRHNASILKKIVATPDIEKRAVDNILHFCFENHIEKANNYVGDLFNNVSKNFNPRKSNKNYKNDYFEQLNDKNSFDNFMGQVNDKKDYDDYWWLRGEAPKWE